MTKEGGWRGAKRNGDQTVRSRRYIYCREVGEEQKRDMERKRKAGEEQKRLGEEQDRLEAEKTVRETRATGKEQTRQI